MSIEGLMVSLVIFLAVAALVAAPFLQRSTSGYNAAANVLQKQHERLTMYYERVLTNIRDLDEDFSTGKMQETDYQAEREEWVQRGIEVLKALDEIDQQHLLVPDADQEALDHAIDDAIERAIAQHRRTAH